MAAKRVCVIGAGPSGMSTLYQFCNFAKDGEPIPDVVCYEKQETWGGLWNFTWRRGLDEYGDKVHGSMYRHLWSNGPKEVTELPDYTYEDHFGKPIASFPPRAVIYDYLEGRWKKADIKDKICFNHRVQHVAYNGTSRDFTVTVKDRLADRSRDETFDYVIVATGHFSTPHVPQLPGIEQFPGRVIHSHDFRDANEFTDQRLLVVGSSYSAEDIALQTLKFGSKHVTTCYRTKPMGFKWPPNIVERPLATGITGKTVSFKDGTSAEVDAIILGTGYLFDLDFMADSIRLTGTNVLYPQRCYKGIIWQPSANDQLMYIGFQDQYYTFTMFEIEAYYAVKVILGKITLPTKEQMDADWKKWRARCDALEDCHEEIQFQTDYMKDLVELSGYPHNLDAEAMLHAWEEDKMESILDYRDKAFKSIFTGTMAPVHHTTFMEAMDDSFEAFIK